MQEESLNIIPIIPLSIDDIDFEAIDCIPTGPDINLVEDLELDRGNYCHYYFCNSLFHYFIVIQFI